MTNLALIRIIGSHVITSGKSRFKVPHFSVDESLIKLFTVVALCIRYRWRSSDERINKLVAIWSPWSDRPGFLLHLHLPTIFSRPWIHLATAAATQIQTETGLDGPEVRTSLAVLIWRVVEYYMRPHLNWNTLSNEDEEQILNICGCVKAIGIYTPPIELRRLN